MTSTDVTDIIKAIATLSFAPVSGAIVYMIKQGYIQKQKLELEKIKLNNEKEQISFLKNKELQNSMTDEKKSILMAWQNIHNHSIRTTKGEETEIDERISLFLNSTRKRVNNHTIEYSLPLGELVSQTLIYSFSPNVHKYIEKLMINTYELPYKQEEFDKLEEKEQIKEMENFKKYIVEQRSKSMAYTFTVYYFLSLEWQGIEKTDTSLDIIGNIYLKDYHYRNDGEIKVMKDEIEKIKSDENL